MLNLKESFNKHIHAFEVWSLVWIPQLYPQALYFIFYARPDFSPLTLQQIWKDIFPPWLTYSRWLTLSGHYVKGDT